jgi:cystathionine gamma-synthase/cystathionine gamma-lyase/cystathionine beta-lyase
MSGLSTRAVHAGEERLGHGGAVVTPIFQSATFVSGGPDGLPEVTYGRYQNTPNHKVLHARLAALEGTEDAVVSATGMAAMTAALLGLCESGDHLLAAHGLYGGTHVLLAEELPKLGIRATFVDAQRPETWAAAAQPRTRAFVVETISNPLCRVCDLKAVAEFCRARGIVSLVDNTFASPVNFRPAEHGFDLIHHSATKYLNGHTDIVAGVIAGRRELVARAVKVVRRLGGSLDPHACFLLERGLKTLVLRVERQNANALRVAGFLARHPQVSITHHPGLPAHPDHARAKELLKGFGGMLAFDLRGGAGAAERFLAAVKIPWVAPSLGGVESLLSRPAATSHAMLTPQERAALGITDGTVRMSVGIEDADDLLADLGQALDHV